MKAGKYFSYIALLVMAASLFSLMVFQQCANIVPPTGGPRDTIPPVIVESKPENYATRVTSPVIELTFDKYIQLRNIDRQLIISPPQKERPDFTIRGKTLRINLNIDLLPNTTYMLNFGQGIVDLNEGNVLEENEFVFSTGDEIDSLYYAGTVLDAYDSKPVEGVVVMLYDELYDSIPYKSMPNYAARTDADGYFRINNLRADTFKVFALEDKGGNYLYDRKGEEAIAFREEHISPLEMPEENDTIEDGRNGHISYPRHDTLYMFREETGRQQLERFVRDFRGKLLFTFRKPLQKEWEIRPLNFSPVEDWKIKEVSKGNDSVIYWITDQEVYKSDSLQFEALYWATGPSDSLKQLKDTITFLKPRTEREEFLEVRTSVRNNGILELNEDFLFFFETPVAYIDEDKISLYHLQDTIVPADFGFVQDTSFLRECSFVSEWIPEEHYKVEILPGAVTDIFGHQNDTINVEFEIRPDDYYGTIVLNLEEVADQVIIQLKDDNNNILREKIANQDTELVFDYLVPQLYRLKAIFDKNRNGVWDTGNYLEGIQPEIGIFYPEAINVRSNWHTEETWNLNY